MYSIATCFETWVMGLGMAYGVIDSTFDDCKDGDDIMMIKWWYNDEMILQSDTWPHPVLTHLEVIRFCYNVARVSNEGFELWIFSEWLGLEELSVLSTTNRAFVMFFYNKVVT